MAEVALKPGREEPKKEEVKKEEKKVKLKKMAIHYEYFDGGNHWCQLCNEINTNMHDWLLHLRSKKHQQVWVSKSHKHIQQNIFI